MPSWILKRTRIPNADPDPAYQFEYGSGSATLGMEMTENTVPVLYLTFSCLHVRRTVLEFKTSIRNVADQTMFKCGSGSGFLTQCRSRSGLRGKIDADPGQSMASLKIYFIHENNSL
jgi:hypothetical protein